jgi:hypothetical protein
MPEASMGESRQTGDSERDPGGADSREEPESPQETEEKVEEAKERLDELTSEAEAAARKLREQQ